MTSPLRLFIHTKPDSLAMFRLRFFVVFFGFFACPEPVHTDFAHNNQGHPPASGRIECVALLIATWRAYDRRCRPVYSVYCVVADLMFTATHTHTLFIAPAAIYLWKFYRLHWNVIAYVGLVLSCLRRHSQRERAAVPKETIFRAEFVCKQLEEAGTF